MGDSSSQGDWQGRAGGAVRTSTEGDLLMFRYAMRQLLNDMGGNESAAAQAIGVEVQTLRGWLG